MWVMINRGHRKELIPDGVELIKSDKMIFNRICSLLGERKFDAVIDFLCYNDKETKRKLLISIRIIPNNIFYFLMCCL